MLSLLRTWVLSLVKELKSHKPCGVARKEREEKKKKRHKRIVSTENCKGFKSQKEKSLAFPFPAKWIPVATFIPKGHLPSVGMGSGLSLPEMKVFCLRKECRRAFHGPIRLIWRSLNVYLVFLCGNFAGFQCCAEGQAGKT